jgi:hypothetical protein
LYRNSRNNKGNPIFHGTFTSNLSRLNKAVKYTGLFKYASNFNDQEKDDIKDNMEKYLQENDKYLISIKDHYIEVNRIFKLRDSMMDELQFETETEILICHLWMVL